MSAEAMRSPESILLEYDLLELPTAQHKAGLAGLLLHLESLAERAIAGAPVAERRDRFGAAVRFTPESMQCLFSDLYAAGLEQVLAQAKYTNKEPLDEVTVEVMRDGKPRQEKRFVYEEVRPTGEVIKFWRPDGAADPWVKLWQNMLWGVLRAQPTTRGEYESVLKTGEVSFVPKLWDSLVKAQKQREKGRFVTDSIAGPLFIGAQDRNAERVPFLGRVEHNLLLHFWHWAAPVYVPRAIDPRKGNWTTKGFLFCIPEVADLDRFCDDMREFWRKRDATTIGRSPAEALIDLPAEGGLEFLYHLGRKQLQIDGLLGSVHAVELYHQEKQGNNVRQLAAERLLPSPRVLRAYEKERRRDAHPLFKRLLIQNLLRGDRWFAGVDSIFHTYPAEFFILGPETSRSTRFFARDAAEMFAQRIQELEKRENRMSQPDPDDVLARLIYKMVRGYVDARARDRARLGRELKYEKFSKEQRDAYHEARPKVASQAFLSLRSRREENIAEYFTGTLCSAGYFLDEAEFAHLGTELIAHPEKVKSLAMLALSASTWTARKEQPAEAETATNA